MTPHMMFETLMSPLLLDGLVLGGRLYYVGTLILQHLESLLPQAVAESAAKPTSQVMQNALRRAVRGIQWRAIT